MAIPKLVNAQRDFSAGELDEDVKRADEISVMKAGARQMANWRITSSKALDNRPGRTAWTLASGRTDAILMPGNPNPFALNFFANGLQIFDHDGNFVAGWTTMQLTPSGSPVTIPWINLGNIVWAQIHNTIYIAYSDGAPNNVPQILTLIGSTWTLTPYAETVEYSGQKRTPFYRISPPGTTLLPSATIGNINITFSTAILSAGMVGTRLEYCGRQLTITGVSSPTSGTATVNENLPPGQTLSATSVNGQINIGDLLIGSVTGATGIVVSGYITQVLLFASTLGYSQPGKVGDTLTGGTSGTTGIVTASSYYFDQTTYRIWLTVQITSGPGFVAGETVTGPMGAVAVTSVTNLGSTSIVVQLIPVGTSDNVIQFTNSDTAVGPSGSFAVAGALVGGPQAVADWDDEVMNLFRGYPASVFADQSRLGFTNFPSVPSGIAWSAIGLPTDLYVAALPDNAIFELAPDNSNVFYVMSGMESSEFIFTDRAIYYIPISPSVPLEPGSVAFNKLSDYGCEQIQPHRAEQSIIYIKAGGTQVGAVQAPGAYYRPYVVDNISEMHSHLLTGRAPLAIAIPSGPAQFAETYLYIAFADGGVISGHYAMRQGLIEPGAEGKPAIGWLPWTGAGSVTWISAIGGFLAFTTLYGSKSIVELLDSTQYLDAALYVNDLPPPFAPPGGLGPLYVFPGPNTTVSLIDLGTRIMGTYQVDSNGFLVPQYTDGEDLASGLLVAGQPWTATLEPFLPGAPPGQSMDQRLRRRRVSHMGVNVSNSTGFVMVRLFAGPITPTSPALGAVLNQRRVATWNPGDDPTQPPPLREEVQRWRPIGRNWDPRVGIYKDTPGPLLVHELGVEVTV